MKHIVLALFLVGCFSHLPTRATGPAVCVETSVIVAKVAMGTLALGYTYFFASARKPPVDPFASAGFGLAFLVGAGLDFFNRCVVR